MSEILQDFDSTNLLIDRCVGGSGRASSGASRVARAGRHAQNRRGATRPVTKHGYASHYGSDRPGFL